MKKIKNTIKNVHYIQEEKLKPVHKKLLELIGREELFNVSQLSKLVNKSIPATSINLKNLHYSEYIVGGSDGANRYFELTRKGKDILRTIGKNLKIIDRCHNILFTFPITRAPKGRFNKNEFIVNTSMKNWASGQLTKIIDENAVIQINNNKSISIMIKEVRASFPELAIQKAFWIAVKTLEDFITENKGLVVGKESKFGVLIANLSRQHHAITKDAFAEICAGKIHIKSKHTNSRFEVDRSHGIPEIEFINSGYSQRDCNRYTDFVRAVIKGKFNYKKVIAHIKNNKVKKDND